MKTGREIVRGLMKRTWVASLALGAVVLLLSAGNPAFADTIVTYDDFSSGNINSEKWTVNPGPGGGWTPSFFSIASGASVGQSYVLHGAGSGDSTTWPRASLNSTTFSGHFGAAMTFFNFSSSGTLPQSTDPRSPSVSLVIGDFSSSHQPYSNYFVVSRTVNTHGDNVIGWREFDPQGNTVVVNGLAQRGSVAYSGASGALEVDYNPVTHTLNLGYFSSTSPSTWNTDPTAIASLTNVSFSGDPRLAVSLAAGATGATVTADVGGLYYTNLGNQAPVPIPPSVLLLAPGLVGLIGLKRKHLG